MLTSTIILLVLLDLLKDGIYGCGTLRSNRSGFPDDIKPMLKKGLKPRGDAITRQCIDHKELTVSAWQDNRVVVVASTNSDEEWLTYHSFLSSVCVIIQQLYGWS